MRPAGEWREHPYPGERPAWSFIQVDEVVLPLDGGPAGWHVEGLELDAWLTTRGAVAMAERTPLLSYGSNPCPSKLVRMRSRDDLIGPVVMTACTVEGMAAAWCTGQRGDGAIPATVVDAPGVESHFLWWVAPEQWSALDRCEGVQAGYYRRRSINGTVRHSDGSVVAGPVEAYIGVADSRLPRTGADGPLLMRDSNPNITGSA